MNFWCVIEKVFNCVLFSGIFGIGKMIKKICALQSFVSCIWKVFADFNPFQERQIGIFPNGFRWANSHWFVEQSIEKEQSWIWNELLWDSTSWWRKSGANLGNLNTFYFIKHLEVLCRNEFLQKEIHHRILWNVFIHYPIHFSQETLASIVPIIHHNFILIKDLQN